MAIPDASFFQNVKELFAVFRSLSWLLYGAHTAALISR